MMDIYETLSSFGVGDQSGSNRPHFLQPAFRLMDRNTFTDQTTFIDEYTYPNTNTFNNTNTFTNTNTIQIKSAHFFQPALRLTPVESIRQQTTTSTAFHITSCDTKKD